MPANYEQLIINRRFKASIERVYAAWTDVELLAQWFGPKGFIVSDSELTLAVGEHYRIELTAPDGQVIHHYGQYVEIDPPHSLIFSWQLDHQDCRGSEGEKADTLVTLTFAQVGDETELTLMHERLPSQAAHDGHHFGWMGSFDSLELLLD